MPVSSWSTTASSNATADSASGIVFSEGQAPSSLNDSARAMMAEIRKWYDETGKVVNSTYAAYTTNADLAVAIPVDDTVPQGTEGTQILSVSLTPSSSTNKLRVRFQGYGSAASVLNIAAALFINGGANAVRVDLQTVPAANGFAKLMLEYEYTPGATTAQTIAVRAGVAGASGTMRFNGSATQRFFGGTSAATLVVEEIKA